MPCCSLPRRLDFGGRSCRSSADRARGACRGSLATACRGTDDGPRGHRATEAHGASGRRPCGDLATHAGGARSDPPADACGACSTKRRAAPYAGRPRRAQGDPPAADACSAGRAQGDTAADGRRA